MGGLKEMSIIYANKEINVNEINCGETAKVTLSLTAQPDFITSPADIVLLIDRSCSLAGVPFSLLKQSLYQFIEQIDEASDGTQNGIIGNGSRIGLVSFAGEAQINVPLSTSLETLKNAIEDLTTGCNSNHYAAFTTATQVLNTTSQNRKFIVLFTASHNTLGEDPAIAAQAAKNAGIIIYGIGVTGLGGLETERLKTWVSQPSEEYAFITNALTELNDIFEELADEIIGTRGVTNVVVTETLNPDFTITNILTPNYGTVRQNNDNQLTWSISTLGTNETQEAVLEFYITHTGTTAGIKEINRAITYCDNEGTSVTFPSPTITVNDNCNCPTTLSPITLEVNAGNCREYQLYNAETRTNETLALNVIIKNLNQARELTLRVILFETRNSCLEEERDIQTFTISPTNCTCSSCSTNVIIRDINFTLPATENLLKIILVTQYTNN